MPESHLHHPQPPDTETGALAPVVIHVDQLPSGFSPEFALAIQRLLKGGGREESALHD